MLIQSWHISCFLVSFQGSLNCACFSVPHPCTFLYPVGQCVIEHLFGWMKGTGGPCFYQHQSGEINLTKNKNSCLLIHLNQFLKAKNIAHLPICTHYSLFTQLGLDDKSWVGVCKRVEALQFFHVFKTILIVSKGRGKCWPGCYFICLVIYLTPTDESFISIPFIDLAIYSIQRIKSGVEVPMEQFTV